VRLLRQALVCVDNADVAQLVEHNLAKVGVAGSNPVVRSREIAGQAPFSKGASSRQDPSIARLSRSSACAVLVHAGEKEREDWIADLDKIAALEPLFVVAGHKKAENDNNPRIIGESQQYLRDFSRIASEEATTGEIVRRMVDLYPHWENVRTLWYSARAEVARKA